jgi:PAS domain S-box-containing protein
MSRLPGIGDRIAERLLAIGFAKGKRPDVARFCAERGYRPQYVYAWLRGRTPTFENLERLATDLRVSRSWLAVGEGDEVPVAMAAQDGGLEPWVGRPSARGPASRERREIAPAGPPAPARGTARLQLLDFARLRDVTGKLVQLEAQLAAIFEAFPDLYIWVDGSGRILDWKGGKTTVPDVLYGPCIGHPIEEVFADETGRRLRHAVTMSILNAEPISVDYTALVNGTDRRFEGRLMPLDSPGSPRPHVMIVVRDITERLKAEQALRDSEARYRELAEGSIECISINVDGRIVFANQAFCDILGYPDPGAVMGLPTSLVTAPEERPRLDGYRQARLRGEPAPIRYEFEALRRDGSRVWLENVVSVINWDGRSAVLATGYDVTDRKRAQEATAALAEAGRELASTLDLDQLLDRILARVFRLLRARRASVYALDSDAGVLRCIASAGDPEVEDIRGRELPLAVTNLSARSVIEGRAVTSTDVLNDPSVQLPEWAEQLNRTQGFRSGLAIPLVGRTGKIGCLIVHDVPGRVFSEHETALLVTLADHAVVALENARLYQESQRRLRHTEALLEVGHAVGSTLDVVEVARRAVRETVLLLHGDMGAAWRLDPGGRFYVPFAGYRIPKETLQHEARLPIPVTAPLIAEVTGRRAPLLIADSTGDPRLDTPLGRAIPHRSVMVLPLESRGAIVGLISVGWVKEAHKFTAADLQLVAGISRELTIAFENAELLAAEQRHVRRQTALVEASRALSTERGLQNLPMVAVEEARRVTGADTAALLLIERGKLVLRATVGAGPAAVEAARRPVPDDAIWRVMTDARAVNLAELPPGTPGWEVVASALEARSMLAVPILEDDHAIGVLLVADRGARAFEPGDVEVMTTLAGQVAFALDNARLHAVNERRLRETSVLREIGLALTGLAPLPVLLETVHTQLGRLLDVSNMVVRLVGPTPGQMRVALRFRGGVRYEEIPPDNSTPLGLGEVVVTRREPLRTDDYLAECRRWDVVPAPYSVEYRYWLGMPMIVGSDLVGVLILRSREKPFSDHDERVLREVATIVAIAIRDAQLYEELTAARDVLTTVAGSAEGLVASDLRGRIVYFSAGAAALTGHSEAQARELTASKFYVGGRREAAALMARLKTEGEVREHRTRIVTLDGTHVPVTVTILPLRDPAGVAIGTLGIVRPRADAQG